MKTAKLNLFAAIITLIAITGCEREAHRDVVPAGPDAMVASVVDTESATATTGKPSPPSGSCNPDAYTITLESKTAVTGGWEWTWSVQNPNPGNGNGGTVQDLSHWGMQFGTCFNTSSMVSAAYSGDGTTWTAFTPTYQSDPSQSCMTTPVLKFDYGTSGTAKSYYKLVVNANYAVASSPGYYKSGGNTGCCTFTFSGIGCQEEEEGETR